MERCKVLIADDNVPARIGLRALLALWPEIEVVGEAADGLEAVQMARDRQPDVVLMDVRMPAMDGLEATRQIKGRWPQVRVVVVSMYASHRAEALAAGADAFRVKGCPPGELLAAILDRQEAMQ
jgi:DNA-binding NarL/FixJ family response regulator